MRWPYNGGILQKSMAYAIICCNSSTSFGSFQYCKLIGLFWKLTRRQLWTLTCPIENCKIILAPKIQRQDNLSVLRQLYHSAKLSDCDLNHSSVFRPVRTVNILSFSFFTPVYGSWAAEQQWLHPVNLNMNEVIVNHKLVMFCWFSFTDVIGPISKPQSMKDEC